MEVEVNAEPVVEQQQESAPTAPVVSQETVTSVVKGEPTVEQVAQDKNEPVTSAVENSEQVVPVDSAPEDVEPVVTKAKQFKGHAYSDMTKATAVDTIKDIPTQFASVEERIAVIASGRSAAISHVKNRSEAGPTKP